MKRCPVCGVMMGDNVARCSMCKYDFQKASQGNNDEAAAEAKRILEQKQQDNIARAEAKRSEEEKRILEALEKLKRDYAAMEEQFETEKAKLDKEFTTYQKKKLAEQEALEKSVDTIRDEVIEARDKRDALRKEANEMMAEAKKKSQKEHDDLIAAAKIEQEKIYEETQKQTEQLAAQVEKEYGEALAKRDELIAQAKEVQSMMDNADKIKAEKEKEIKAAEAKIVKLGEDFEKEKARLAEEHKKLSEKQAAEALKMKADAERDRDIKCREGEAHCGGSG